MPDPPLKNALQNSWMKLAQCSGCGNGNGNGNDNGGVGNGNHNGNHNN